jgi:MvaI/BcnI restriction endonuclease family
LSRRKTLPEITSLRQLTALMREQGTHTLVYKRLAPNDNSKNQVYLGGNFSALQLLPFGGVQADESRKDSKRNRFKADLSFYWLSANGHTYEAPDARLILYPKYPEVRMSGFLKGAEFAPSAYLTCRDEGRVLLMGITNDRNIIGHVVGPENPLARELEPYDSGNVLDVIFQDRTEQNTRQQLLARLKEVHDMGWVDSAKLDSEGILRTYRAQNGGGYTLEGLLGIPPNGINEPDYLGWEIKQHAAKPDKPLSGNAITLITPEPTGGIYKSRGVIDFVRMFGYPDTKDRDDRFNFGGIHKIGERQKRTGLTMQLAGFDSHAGKIVDIHGGITLLSDDGTEAAVWHYSSLLEKWNRKHAQAVYVPSQKREAGNNQYWYGHTVALGVGTDFGKFLDAMAAGSVYYDPGIKVEDMSTKPKFKKRSQFRVRPPKIPGLYETIEIVDLNAGHF